MTNEIKMNPWHPISNPIDLKHLGKFGEELSECCAAVNRCIIQGVEEKEPVTGKLNKDWLEDEIADVLAGIDLTIKRFNLDTTKIAVRTERKINQLIEWHMMA